MKEVAVITKYITFDEWAIGIGSLQSTDFIIHADKILISKDDKLIPLEELLKRK